MQHARPPPDRARWPPSGPRRDCSAGLFGVGGGTVIVPLLVLWLGYGEREATGTSLAAIVIIAAVAALTQGAYGNVHVGDGLLDRHPRGRRGAAGTWLQQRVRPRAVSLLFAALLVGRRGRPVVR